MTSHEMIKPFTGFSIFFHWKLVTVVFMKFSWKQLTEQQTNQTLHLHSKLKSSEVFLPIKSDESLIYDMFIWHNCPAVYDREA